MLISSFLYIPTALPNVPQGHFHSPLHHPPKPYPWVSSSSNQNYSTTRGKFLMCKCNRLSPSNAQYSLWLLTTYRIKSQFLHHPALPTCSASSSAGPFLHFTDTLIPWLCFLPALRHLHIYSSCLKCSPPPTQQI